MVVEGKGRGSLKGRGRIRGEAEPWLNTHEFFLAVGRYSSAFWPMVSNVSSEWLDFIASSVYTETNKEGIYLARRSSSTESAGIPMGSLDGELR
jgi:hypothetical protein